MGYWVGVEGEVAAATTTFRRALDRGLYVKCLF